MGQSDMEKIIAVRDSRKDRAYSLYICAYLLVDILNSIVQDVFQISGTKLLAFKALWAGLLLVLFLRAVCHFNMREWTGLFAVGLLAFSAYAYSFVMGVSPGALAGWAVNTFGVCIPLLVCAMNLRDKQTLYDMLRICSYILFILLIVEMTGYKRMVRIPGENRVKKYDLHFSYSLLLVIIVHINELTNGKSKLYVVTIISGLLMLVLFGSRGTLVCVLAFAVLKVMTNIRNNLRRIAYLALLAVGFVGLYYISEHPMLVYNVFSALGLTSRTLRMIASGNFINHDSGRSELWGAAIAAIGDRPVFGWGIRGAVGRLVGHPYPHQFFFDLWLAFGIGLGSVIIVALLTPVRKLITLQKGPYKDLVQIFACLGFVPLMFSSTLFQNEFYHVFLGLTLAGGAGVAQRLSIRCEQAIRLILPVNGRAGASSQFRRLNGDSGDGPARVERREDAVPGGPRLGEAGEP